jgi:hypothetical protein
MNSDSSAFAWAAVVAAAATVTDTGTTAATWDIRVVRREGRVAASGYIELMPVGAGTTEVRLCLTSSGGRSRSSQRRLIKVADSAGNRLLGRAE